MKSIIHFFKFLLQPSYRRAQWQKELDFAKRQMLVIEEEFESYKKLPKPVPTSIRDDQRHNQNIAELYTARINFLEKKLSGL